MNPTLLSRRHFLGTLNSASAIVMAPHRLSAEVAGERKLGIALVGLGKYSTGQLGPALKLTKACKLAGVVTGSPEKARQWAAEHGFPETGIYNLTSSL